MLTGLDGVVIEVAELAVGVRAFERLLGIAPQSVDRPGIFTDAATNAPTEAAVFDLGNTKLELRAPAPSEGIAGLRFAFRHGPDHRFTAGRVESPSVPVELVEVRDEDEAGAAAVAGRGAQSGLLGLDHVVVATREVERARRFFGDELGLRLALDRRFPERGLRLLFFRLSGVTIEIASTLADAAPGDPADPEHARDAFRGLALKVEGIDAVHARLAAAGLSVSAVRDGFKPGTRVFGSSTAVHGVTFLWIEHPPRPGW